MTAGAEKSTAGSARRSPDMKSKDAGSIPATSTVIMPLTRRFIESARTTVRLRDGAGLLTCDDAVQRSRIPLPPPPLQGNGFHVFSAR